MWVDTVPELVHLLREGSPQQRKLAYEDLMQLARALDRLHDAIERELQASVAHHLQH